MKTAFTILLTLCISLCTAYGADTTGRIDLSGPWRFQLDPTGFGKAPGSEIYLARLPGTIMLPGSTDQAGQGIMNTARRIDRLSRRFEYCGQAWYQKDIVIPEEWAGKTIVLEFERCHWETSVYVDGTPSGCGERLSVPNRFDLTGQLTPGPHTVTVCVDNRLKYPMDYWNHATTEHTQTNWNGIIGEMSLKAYGPDRIRNIRIFPDAAGKAVGAEISLCRTGQGTGGTLSLTVRDMDGSRVASGSTGIGPGDRDSLLSMTLQMKRRPQMWDEFSPYLYTLEAVWEADGHIQKETYRFGFREIGREQNHITLNGRKIHLRGTLECAVFPRTGYPAVDKESWLKIFRTVREYGMNHVRFHSWCPPEAAFSAADETGIYIQAELPMWIKDAGKYPGRRDFFEDEMYALLDEYGNHPSFILMCNGNENEGDFSVLEDLVCKARRHDARRLYSASTARTHVEADQFYVTHMTDRGWATAYEGRPDTEWTVDAGADIDVPVIAHESGQRCMYPDFRETVKYDGVLEPRNMEVFRERLAANGMLAQAEDFFRATGAHTVLQYKDVNEALLRSGKSAGFQLLGLSDFPGQGSSYVGILDAFWEDKGLVTPAVFRESCAPTVLLAYLPKRVYSGGEAIRARIGLYHYGPEDIAPGSLRWSLQAQDGTIAASGRTRHGRIGKSTVSDSLCVVGIPEGTSLATGQYTLHAWLGDVHNEWNIWIFASQEAASCEAVPTVTSWEQARAVLEAGGSALYIPKEAKGRKTRFSGHFWNPVIFKWDPLVVGTLIDCGHPSLKGFPTSYYADWQWYDILNAGTAIDVTALRGLVPVIQPVDTYEVNRKLALAFEVRSGEGRLFVLSVDMDTDMDSRPASGGLLRSVMEYVASGAFSPAVDVPLHELDAIFSGDENGED